SGGLPAPADQLGELPARGDAGGGRGAAAGDGRQRRAGGGGGGRGGRGGRGGAGGGPVPGAAVPVRFLRVRGGHADLVHAGFRGAGGAVPVRLDRRRDVQRGVGGAGAVARVCGGGVLLAG